MKERVPAVVGALGFFIAAYATSSRQSLGYDELFTVWVASQPWTDLVPQANLDGFTPPLFYALVKGLMSLGLRNEGLRLLPVIFGGVAVIFAIDATERLFGRGARLIGLLIATTSAYLFTFAHELRPYSALLGCAFFFMGQMAGPPSERSDRRALSAALIATAFSYLGACLLATWLWECRRRVTSSRVALLGAIGLVLVGPGLAKALKMFTARQNAAGLVLPDGTPAAGVVFGLSGLTSVAWLNSAVILGCAVLIVSILLLPRLRDVPTLRAVLGALVSWSFMGLVLDAAVHIGFAPRYFALVMVALLLLVIGVLGAFPRVGPGIAVLIAGVNLGATSRYLTADPPARENWRLAIERMAARLDADGVLLAFPFHHAAVAAHAYSPGMKVGGGYTSRAGPTFWYAPPALFRGYAFDELQTIADPMKALGAVAAASDVCLVSDEPDPTKTASVFTAFEALGSVRSFDSGDPRIRVVCRVTGLID